MDMALLPQDTVLLLLAMELPLLVMLSLMVHLLLVTGLLRPGILLNRVTTLLPLKEKYFGGWE